MNNYSKQPGARRHQTELGYFVPGDKKTRARNWGISAVSIATIAILAFTLNKGSETNHNPFDNRPADIENMERNYLYRDNYISVYEVGDTRYVDHKTRAGESAWSIANQYLNPKGEEDLSMTTATFEQAYGIQPGEVIVPGRRFNAIPVDKNWQLPNTTE